MHKCQVCCAEEAGKSTSEARHPRLLVLRSHWIMCAPSPSARQPMMLQHSDDRLHEPSRTWVHRYQSSCWPWIYPHAQLLHELIGAIPSSKHMRPQRQFPPCTQRLSSHRALAVQRFSRSCARRHRPTCHDHQALGSSPRMYDCPVASAATALTGWPEHVKWPTCTHLTYLRRVATSPGADVSLSKPERRSKGTICGAAASPCEL